MEQSARLEGYVVGALQSGGFEGPATKLPPSLIYLDKMLCLEVLTFTIQRMPLVVLLTKQKK